MSSPICLTMIVKDEAHCVATGLRSARGLIDRWLIIDTGSTDGTQEVVRQALEGIPGELVERPWVDFGHNRDEALSLARANAGPGEYALSFDADEHLADLPERGLDLELDGYHLELRFAGTRYQRLALVRLDRPWRWLGPIHEYLELPGAKLGRLARPVVVVERIGARSRDPLTYRKDAALIERHLAAHPGDPRMEFYLAQSWRDAGEWERALAGYRVRLANEAGWDQERWFAALQIATLLERLGHPPGEVADAYLAAYQLRPSRAEPLVELARVERLRTRYDVALLYATRALELPVPPATDLFVEADAYAWRRFDEYAVSAYWCGRFAEGVAAARTALAARPDDQRLQANLGYFDAVLGDADPR